jgi:hypothetical protein
VTFRGLTAALASAGPARAGEAPAPIYSRTATLEIDHRHAKSAELGNVELWVTADEGRTWSLAGEDPALTGKITYKAPGQGTFGFVTVAVDKAGRAGKRPVAGSDPAVQVVVDWSPPIGRVLRPLTSGTLEVNLTYELKDDGPARLASADIWYTRDDGRIWRKLAPASLTEPSVKVRLPGQGTYGLALSAKDRADNELLPPGQGMRPAFTLICDTDPPRLKLIAPSEGAVFAGGAIVPVEWKAEDANFGEGPITVECSTDGGNSWTVAAGGIPNTGRFDEWKAPKVDSAQCLVRIWAEDKVGNRSSQMSRPFKVDSTAPSTRPESPVPPPERSRPPGEKAPPTTPPPADVSEAELLARAERSLRQGRNAEAAEAAGRIIARNDRSALAYHLRARALLTSDPAAAARDLEKVVNLAPDTAGLFDLLGEARYRAGVVALQKDDLKAAGAELSRAAESFRRALVSGADSWVRHYNLGLTLIGLARTENKPELSRDAAERELTQALDLVDPQDKAVQAGIVWYQAILSQDQGNGANAAFFWRRAADLHGRGSALGRKAIENAERAERRR